MKAKVLDSPGNIPCTASMAMILLACSITAWADQNEVDSISTKVAQSRPTAAARDLAAVEERRSITGELLTLTKSGASPERIAEWQENNTARLAINQQKLAAISARQISIPQPYTREIQIPPGASAVMEAFLMERAKLNNEQVSMHNQTLQASPEKRGEALEAWQKQNADALDAQASRASQISAESPPPASRVPASASIPRDATPELRDFLTQRNALIKAEAEVTARLKTATPEQHQQALEAWRVGNSSPIRAMQEAAVRLSNESKTSD